MFNIDRTHGRMIRRTLKTAFAFWLPGQIADASLFERLWNQAAIIILGAGVHRAWMLERVKPI